MKTISNTFKKGGEKVSSIYEDIKSLFKSDHFSSYLVLGVVAFTAGIMGLSDLAVSFLFKDDYKMSPSEVAMIQSFINLPWIFKPCWGIISDCIPLFQFRRKSYLILCGFISFGMYQMMAHLIRVKEFGFISLFLIAICGSFSSVIAEALVVEISQKRAKSNSNWIEEQQQSEAAKNVSLFFGIRSVGALVVAYLSGRLLEHFSKYTVFAITSFFPLMIVFASFFLDEERTINNDKLLETTKHQIKSFWNFITLPVIYRPILFILCFMMMPSSGSVMFFFYTNVLGFQPEFLGQLRFIYACGSIFATICYNKFLKNVQFKKQFTYSTLISSLVGLTQILLVTRANVSLGIPDKIFTVSDNIMLQIIGEFNMIPILVVACRLCPKDIEGTMYALLMSTINFGSIISDQLGGALTYSLGINENKFDNLWILVLITNILQVTPLIYLSKVDLNSAQEITEQTHNQDSQDEETVKTEEQNNKNEVNESDNQQIVVIDESEKDQAINQISDIDNSTNKTDITEKSVTEYDMLNPTSDCQCPSGKYSSF